MKAEDFVKQALEHYEAKLKEETERFGVTFITDEFVEHGSDVPLNMQVWKDLTEAEGKKYTPMLVDAQIFVLIVSESEIPRPEQYHALWQIVQDLKNEDPEAQIGNDLGEKIESLDFYDGPYRLELPEDLQEG